MKELTLGSLFDGIGGWQIAAVRAGIRPVWSSEIEKFPMEVTKKWFPETKQLGDITKIDGAAIEPVDIICAGSPCQDLSIAGNRAGLAGERSGLFVKSIEIFRAMREATGGEKPRWFVWENVPGAFSSHQGEDFRTVLEQIGQADIPVPQSHKWAQAGMVRTEAADICWRVLDAQYWGAPNVARESSLSQILESGGNGVPEKYYLTPRACAGILRRAEHRGRPLPMPLKAALQRQASPLGTSRDDTSTTSAESPKHSQDATEEAGSAEA